MTAPTAHRGLLEWVSEVAELTTPDRVVWCDGSPLERRRLTDGLVEAGTLVRLEKKPNSFWCASDPTDVALDEEHTYLCTADEADAGPAGNWTDPLDMKIVMTEHYRGSMAGRTMYVVPFCLGPLTAEKPVLGVEITDSAYVVISLHVMTRAGSAALELFGEDAQFVRCLHSVGAPLKPGQADVPWPCDGIRYVAQFPEERMVWSYGSGHGGNALLGIASVMARDEGWFAEHMLVLKLTSPHGTVHHIAAAFPSGCGKTSLAMLEPSIPGWKVETLGDDVAWLRFGDDGRLYAVNPGNGFSGAAPGTGWKTHPNVMRALAEGNSVFTNVALTDDGDVWWEGCSDIAPDHLTSWRGDDWTPESPEPAAHPGSRYRTPIAQCPVVAPEWDDPEGVPISAIFFGGRRATAVPLVAESFDWQHGVFLGATLSSETTGGVRRDPMAMLSFLGYHVGDYLQHWIDAGKDTAKLPKIFYVNWFRRGDDGRLLWPGFGENARILKWVADRIEGHATAFHTPVGWVPGTKALDLRGLDPSSHWDVRQALTVDHDEWRAELPLIEQWFAAIGDRLPAALHDELEALRRRLD
jgi:phosphoenolpyruvate carboxykinase (GTP)